MSSTPLLIIGPYMYVKYSSSYHWDIHVCQVLLYLSLGHTCMSSTPLLIIGTYMYVKYSSTYHWAIHVCQVLLYLSLGHTCMSSTPLLIIGPYMCVHTKKSSECTECWDFAHIHILHASVCVCLLCCVCVCERVNIQCTHILCVHPVCAYVCVHTSMSIGIHVNTYAHCTYSVHRCSQFTCSSALFNLKEQWSSIYIMHEKTCRWVDNEGYSY